MGVILTDSFRGKLGARHLPGMHQVATLGAIYTANAVIRSDSRASEWATETAESAEGRRIKLSIMYSSYWTSLGGITR